jgi:hypothetical protein
VTVWVTMAREHMRSLDELLGAGQDLARQVPPDAWAWCLYFSDWNACAYCAAMGVTFRWVK